MKEPKIVGAKVLYLDYDGVLHPEDVYRHPKRGIFLGGSFINHHLFENAHHLVGALEKYPDVSIVLSTTWVRILGYSRARDYLPEGLRWRVVGATFHSSMHRDIFVQMGRPNQVLADVTRRRPLAWVAIDDITDGWPHQSLSHFVPSHPVLGCGAKDVLEILERRLGENFGPGNQ